MQPKTTFKAIQALQAPLSRLGRVEMTLEKPVYSSCALNLSTKYEDKANLKSSRQIREGARLHLAGDEATKMTLLFWDITHRMR